MYILGNAINTEILNLYPVEVPLYVKIIIELLVIIFAAFLFLLFNEFATQVITSLLIVILFTLINYFIFYTYGVFFNFILPVLGMGFHRTISSYEELVRSGIRKFRKH